MRYREYRRKCEKKVRDKWKKMCDEGFCNSYKGKSVFDQIPRKKSSDRYNFGSCDYVVKKGCPKPKTKKFIKKTFNKRLRNRREFGMELYNRGAYRKVGDCLACYSDIYFLL